MLALQQIVCVATSAVAIINTAAQSIPRGLIYNLLCAAFVFLSKLLIAHYIAGQKENSDYGTLF